MPTPEDYGPLIPISTYGASKLASEALMTSYAHTFGHRALILRFANIVGPRSSHGVIVDFVRKLRANPAELEILGDGTQKKSYMYITDLVDAVVHLTGRFLERSDTSAIYNVGTEDSVTVKEIAGLVIKEMNLQKVRFKFTGGVDGGRGWRGDVKNMCLSTEKLLATGWKPRYSSREAVRLASRKIIRELCAD
jgi:UDP-glucose 4-epimerase